jgi:hypothetical protein
MGIIKDGQRFDPRLVVKQAYDFFLMSIYWKRFIWRDDRYAFLAKHYTNKGGVFRKKINEKACKYDILMPEDEIPRSAQVRVKEVDISTINHYRNMYLSKKIQLGSGGPCFLVFAGNKLFGFLIFQAYSKKGGPSNEIYLLSDFVVPSTRYRRLAKLLLMAVTCREMKQVLDEMHIRDYASILTTAFTDRPVSMKYRGVFDLAKRGEGFLNYRGTFGENAFKEVVSSWMKKYEKQ